MATLIAQGDVYNIHSLGDYDNRFNEGDKGYLEMQLHFIPPGMDQILATLDWGLRQAGVELTHPSEVLSERRVRIYFKRAVPPLFLIAAALVGIWLIVLGSWKLFKEEAQQLSQFILVLVGISLAAIVIVGTKGKFRVPGLEIGK